MVFDTNAVIAHIRRKQLLPARAVLPVVVVGELRAFVLKSNWGYQRVAFLEYLFGQYPVVAIIEDLTNLYAHVDAYSQGKLIGQPLPTGLTARNMGKNDLWIAATALDLDMPLHTADHDFDHLLPLGLILVKEL
ncbi:PIN domain-containing protein [Hymenobacter sp.]|uniref:PIN domain-containing protein n=1 Tax=Hymenobacter sp. TaxID=1898978 RepID=UPI00286CE986|nr:PIN domain-containing protein [Hymenobacter sp.]